MVVFKYRKEISRAGLTVKRPVALVEFLSKDHLWIPQELYIDSGADITLLPYSVGDLLGFRMKPGEKTEEIGGIAGKIPIVFRQVKIKIDNYQLEIKVAWSLLEETPPLLGREDIFDNFEVTFKQKEGLVIFKKTK